MSDKPNPLAVLQAKKAYYDFTGAWPKRTLRAKLDAKPVAAYGLGEMVGVAYEATRDGKTDQYFHRFKKKARPHLGVRSDGKQLYVLGGDYHVTDRGIEDMPGVFMVNPSKRRRKAKTGRKANGQFKRNPTAPQRAAAKRARPPARITVTARQNPSRRRRRRMGFRRNPLSVGHGKGSFDILTMFFPAVMVGGGAVVAEVAMGYLPIPDNFKTGNLRYVTKMGISVAVGWAVSKFANKSMGEAIALGGVAITAHDLIKAQLIKAMPTLAFGGRAMGYYNPGYVMDQTANPQQIGQYVQTPMGQYVPRSSFAY